MKEICFATSNSEKVQRLNDALERENITDIQIVQREMDLPEPRSEDIQQIAEAKARFAYQQIQRPCVVQDSGFFIYSLNGFPRAFVNFCLRYY